MSVLSVPDLAVLDDALRVSKRCNAVPAGDFRFHVSRGLQMRSLPCCCRPARMQVCVASWQGVDGVKKACAATSSCAGFTFDGKCGFLKTAVGEAKGRNGWAVFAVKKP